VLGRRGEDDRAGEVKQLRSLLSGAIDDVPSRLPRWNVAVSDGLRCLFEERKLGSATKAEVARHRLPTQLSLRPGRLVDAADAFERAEAGLRDPAEMNETDAAVPEVVRAECGHP
jgi:hypothetical protein